MTERPRPAGPLASLLDVTLARLRGLDPEALAHVAERRARHDVEQRASRLELTLQARGVPRDANVRAAVRRDAAAATAPLLDAVAGLRWRRGRRLPSGESPGLVLILQGPPGCGKSTAGAWVAARWPRDALFLTAEELGAVPDTDWSTHVDARERWRRVDLLILDDVGAERDGRATSRVASRCGPLLLARYNEGRATLVTTNRDAEAFCDGYLATDEPDATTPGNGRLADRLRAAQQGAGCPYWYQYQGAESYRGPDGEARLATLETIPSAVLAELR